MAPIKGHHVAQANVCGRLGCITAQPTEHLTHGKLEAP